MWKAGDPWRPGTLTDVNIVLHLRFARVTASPERWRGAVDDGRDLTLPQVRDITSRAQRQTTTNEQKGGSHHMFRYRGRVAAALIPVLVAGTAAVATPSDARADLRLCNNTSSRVGIAIGYKGPNTWVSEGWWNIDADDCQVVVDGPLSSRYYYLYALDYSDSGAWGGSSYMCTDQKEFTIDGTNDCIARGYERRGFVEVDTRDSAAWTIQLTARPTMGIGGR